MRELRITIGCVEIHETECPEEMAHNAASKLLALPLAGRDHGMVVDVDFKAGRARGKLRLRGLDLPTDAIRALQDAIRTKVLEGMTTEAVSGEPDPSSVDSILSQMSDQTDAPAD